MYRRALVVTVVVALAVAAPLAAQQYRSRGVTVADYQMVEGDLYVMCEIWEGCESGRFELSIEYDDYGHHKRRTAYGSWANGASTVSVRVRLTRDSTVLAVVVVGVWPDC